MNYSTYIYIYIWYVCIYYIQSIQLLVILYTHTHTQVGLVLLSQLDHWCALLRHQKRCWSLSSSCPLWCAWDSSCLEAWRLWHLSPWALLLLWTAKVNTLAVESSSTPIKIQVLQPVDPLFNEFFVDSLKLCPNAHRRVWSWSPVLGRNAVPLRNMSQYVMCIRCRYTGVIFCGPFCPFVWLLSSFITMHLRF